MSRSQRETHKDTWNQRAVHAAWALLAGICLAGIPYTCVPVHQLRQPA